MGTINDDKLQAVRTLLGVTTGDIQARWREHLVALTSGSGTLNDLEMLWLGGLGYTGALNDRWQAYLTGLSYTGTVNDQAKAFWLAGGPQSGGESVSGLDLASDGLPWLSYSAASPSDLSPQMAMDVASDGLPFVTNGVA